MYSILLIGTSVGLAMDACAVSAAAAARARQRPLREALPMAATFGIWQAGMFLLGTVAGSELVAMLAWAGRWLAAAVLVFLSARLAYGLWQQDAQTPVAALDYPRGRTLQLLGLATSIDAAAAGLGLAMVAVAPGWPAVVVGATTAVLALAAAWLGRRIGQRLGRGAEALGAIVLLAVAVAIVL